MEQVFSLDFWKFARAVRSAQRFIRAADTDAFLAAVVASAVKRATVIEADTLLWRAQVGCEEREDESGYDILGHPPERMSPMPGQAREGRLNPKGIPYLYMSSSMGTAIAEVRPARGAYVSLGVFRIVRDVKVVNCSADEYKLRVRFGARTPATYSEEEVWGEINRAFSQPVEASDMTADYVPTQILAEVFRRHGYDGVMFASSVGNGHNVALSELSLGKLVRCHVHRVDGIEYRTSECANPYFVKSELKRRDGGAVTGPTLGTVRRRRTRSS